MLNRLSSNALLKSVIAVMAALVVLMLALGAWGSWQRVTAARRIAEVVDASSLIFKAMHNLRIDRTFTARHLMTADGPVEGNTRQQIERSRADEMPALKAAAAKLKTVDFADHDALVGALEQALKTLAPLQTETWDALNKPKSARRDGLAKEHTTLETALLDTLDKLSARLTAAVKLSDPTVDQMMAIKQLAWIVRNAAGDASVVISSGLIAGKPLAPEMVQKYAGYVSRIDTAWDALEDMAFGTALRPRLIKAIEGAKATFFDPKYTGTRDRLLKQLAAGEKPDMTANEWTPMSLPRLNGLLAVAESALEAAKEHAIDQQGAATRDLAINLGLLVLALGLAAGSMMAVSRRVIRPLHRIQDAMLKVASGDLSVEVSFGARRDEIGALAGALGAFKQNAVEKARIEEEQRTRHAQAAERQKAIEGHITGFEGQMREALETLGAAATQMRATSDSMSGTAAQTNDQVHKAAAASEEASTNVQTVAAASEELSASIGEISRQVSHAATIAGRAVEETHQTDSTVQGLAESAGRIGDVVKLISDIAEQTNLLALNATIEAARAGEAGKGFAVVASEVKSLATQTAKATEDIAAQISAIQRVTQDAVEAIRRIGGTIGEVSTVATSIASAVEEQGAATQEITRNTQEAARRTKDVSENIAGVAEGADATGHAADGVKSAADALGQRTEQLRSQVGEFLAKIRAA
ncbi:MAG TPA: HAMP domain-containing methyl-accepting chemotaxis protein [Alphaproteobacteria bacterium]|nr:HAMP domain-containing methyl-accepting chemotaxis protein [Alphaproteobacteria bacterium]